ncbi:hypothetical protein G3I01_06375 [Gramella sp. MT6]|uniref:hypothetical protein n=1 Tax=Gramella sp. MT6 TaxID=2705471 RepID=UPI001C5E9FBE|nr:hypothetical protein [Gramella sp. MT6]QYA25152.1 hypothetical protein G3I01_06375 [Gramella sp. MT6]
MDLKVKKNLVVETLELLKSSPDKEKVLLWLGHFQGGDCIVAEIFDPIQICDLHYFKIPEEGMIQLLEKLRKSGFRIVAQIHTHPFEAYHSEADDEWAIIRHLNAFSLVLPYFCATTTIDNFLENVASFSLTSKNEWKKINNSNLLLI